MGDLQAAYEATAIPNIQFYLALDIPFRLARVVNRFLNLVAGLNVSMMEFFINKLTPPLNRLKKLNGDVKGADKTRIDIRLEQADGISLTGTLITGEGYDFTAQATVLAVEKVLTGKLVGAMIPGQAFDADFVLQAEGVEGFIHHE